MFIYLFIYTKLEYKRDKPRKAFTKNFKVPKLSLRLNANTCDPYKIHMKMQKICYNLIT